MIIITSTVLSVQEPGKYSNKTQLQFWFKYTGTHTSTCICI